jgi:BirA family biotin operon repressor/biotin-[acetyl-CoA-carboxylase] ligase
VNSPDFDARRLRSAIAGGLCGPVAREWALPDAIDVVATTGSTNADLVQFGRADVQHPERLPARRFLAALDQTAGRGRHGRDWLAGSGQITFSIGLKLPVRPAGLSGLALVCGLAVHAALASHGVDLRLKWPNDIVDRDAAKLGGMLVEVVALGADGPVWVVIGIGVNRQLGAAAREQLAGRVVTDLDRLGAAALDANAFAAATIARLEADLPAFLDHGFAPFREAFDRAHLHHDRLVTLSDGRAQWPGRFIGTGSQGEARLRLDDEREVVHLSGELSLRALPE